MTYTHLTLFLFGLLGVMLHNLVKMNAIKQKDPNGDVKFGWYIKMEWINITISILVVVGMVWTSQEISDLANAGKWLGPGFIAGGYQSQSLLTAFMGKAQKVIDQKTNA